MPELLATWAERADKSASPASIERANADIALGQLALIRGDLSGGREKYHSAFEIARDLGDQQVAFRSAIFLLSSGSDEGERLQLAEDFSRRSRGGVSAVTLSAVLQFSSQVLLGHGRRAEADALVTQLREHAERTREPISVIQARGSEYALSFVDGKLTEVANSSHEMNALRTELGHLGGAVGPMPFSLRAQWLMGHLGPDEVTDSGEDLVTLLTGRAPD
jgi:hypothetical protein